MLEFRIVEQIGEGTPFSLWSFKSYEQCYLKLIDLIHDCKTSVKKEYYVINEFYNNEYPPFLSDIRKFKIECREVDDWVIYNPDVKSNNKNKIVQFRRNLS